VREEREEIRPQRELFLKLRVLRSVKEEKEDGRGP